MAALIEIVEAVRDGKAVRLHRDDGEVLVVNILAYDEHELTCVVLTSSRPERYAVCDSTGTIVAHAEIERARVLDRPPARTRAVLKSLLLLALGLALSSGPAHAVEIPEEGDCPPYPVPEGGDAPQMEDVVPPLVRPGQLIPLDQMSMLSNYLPQEVWNRRQVFFYEGMELEVGPCHRRYNAPPFFVEATDGNTGRVTVDAEQNLVGYDGAGLPFRWQDIPDDAPDAGVKWAWNSRYRYMGSGFRGNFRILHVARRGQKIDRFLGRFYWLPMHGVPGASTDPNGARFWAGGSFKSPPVARGVAWRQLRSAEADQNYKRSDDVWVWIPDERKVRRSPPTAIDGVFMPSYMRGTAAGFNRAVFLDGTEVPGESMAAAEHTRIGFAGLLMRPNAYTWTLLRVQDVIAPINAPGLGYPADPERSYGPSGQSFGSERWDIRRAVVIQGDKKQRDDQIGTATFYIDALTQQPLYLITRRRNGNIFEVGMFMGRFSGDDPIHPRWKGSGPAFGTILPVAASFYQAGGTGWVRESYELRSDPPTNEEANDFTSTIKLQRGR
jgi:hypothetical protein